MPDEQDFMETSTVIELHREAGRGKVLARSYDYVIVGAGSAGCVVARRLLDGTDATVLLLEAGGSDEGVKSISNPPQWVENIGSPYDWAYRYEPSPHVDGRSIPLALGKVLGGSGSINGMIWARGNRADYDGWAEAGNAGWDFHSVLPLFKKSEDWEDGASEFRGAGGPIRVERARNLHPAAAALIDAGKSYGMPYLDDMNVPEPEGVGPMNENVRDGTRCSPARAYLRPVMGQQEPDGPDRGAGGQADALRHALHRPRFPAGRPVAFRARVQGGDPLRRGDPYAAPPPAVRHRPAG